VSLPEDEIFNLFKVINYREFPRGIGNFTYLKIG
jgi:hypothetical protein